MVWLSLFNGMSCGYMAAQVAKLPIDVYYSSEIDKYANKVSDYLFPNIIQIGDVRNIDVSKLEPIDILIGGSPCQSFSFAGKRKGMVVKKFPNFVPPTDDQYLEYLNNEDNVYLDYEDYCQKEEERYEIKCNLENKEIIEIYTLDHYLELKANGFEFEGQSYLFWEYMRILNDIRKYNPNVLFLLENVEMGEKWEVILSKAIGIKGVHINSALVSAQNRKRIYWTNINKKTFGLWGYEYADIPQPKDRGILLKDILESDVAEKYYLSDKIIKNMMKWEQRNIESGNGFKNEIKSENEKSCAIPTGSMKSSSTYLKIDKQGNPKQNQDKASCFTAGAHSGGNHSDMDLICVAMRGRNPDNPSDRTTGTNTKQTLEPKTDGKTNCLTSVQKGNLIMQINPSTESGGKQPYQQNRVYDADGITPALCANKSDLLITSDKSPCLHGFEHGTNGQLNKQLMKGSMIRRLTERECARLQTVPEHLIDKMMESGVFSTQLYKMLGNGWTIEVIAHIFKQIK